MVKQQENHLETESQELQREKEDLQRLQEVIPVHIPAHTDTPAWKEIQNKENQVGSETLLEELLDKKILNDVEMLWIVRHMMGYYGKEDSLLKKAPARRLMANTNELLRIIFLLLDRPKGEIEPNMRSYLSAKLQQATWGINQNTRRYLGKMKEESGQDDSVYPPIFSI